jgi:hypothetical protein
VIKITIWSMGLRLATDLTGRTVFVRPRAAFNKGMGFVVPTSLRREVMKFSRSVFAKVAAVAVVLAAAGTASVAQARVFASVGINLAPGVVVGASNYYAPAYYPPVYAQPQPYYVQPAPVYYEQAYYAPAPVYYGPPVFIGGRWVYGHRHFAGRGFHGHRR